MGTKVAPEDLKSFFFKEVLNADSSRKVIFILLEDSASEKQQAVLICDKQPFVEGESEMGEWIQGSSLHHLLTNANFHSYLADLPQKHNATKMTLIYPASQRDIDKYRRQRAQLLTETPEDFATLTAPYIESIKSNLEWVYNFLDGKAEAERVVFKDEDPVNGFMLAPDLKWAGKDVDTLYLQAVVNRRDLRSVRDLTQNEVPLLEAIRNKSAKAIKEKYGLEANQLLMYMHYQPTFYHLHVHIINLKYEAPGLHITSILLNTAIDNLKRYPDYYKNATLQFMRRDDPLLKKFKEAGRLG